MRLRRILLILVILAVLALTVVVALNRSGEQVVVTPAPVPEQTEEVVGEASAQEAEGEEPELPTPTPTPALRLANVVVAKVDIPLGERILPRYLEIVQRPDDNIAVLAGVTFEDPEMVIGQIARTHIAQGQEVIAPMVALDARDIGNFGSDLALYVEGGRVAIAFPIDRYSGLAYGMRPGDFVDVLMSLSLVEIDPEFRARLPNQTQRIDQDALLNGTAFLFPASTQGRLELIPELNLVAEIVPGGEEAEQIPRRVTQHTIQQAEVLWVGTWVDPRERERQLEAEAQARTAAAQAASDQEFSLGAEEEQQGPTVVQEASQLDERFENRPDVVILSLPAQDALALKWSMERGVNIDLALRAQGDISVFLTTSVSLPQLVEQGGLTIPEINDFDISPRLDEIVVPSLPPSNPNN